MPIIQQDASAHTSQVLGRFSRLIQYRTVSQEGPQPIDPEVFRALREELQSSFPLSHARLQWETVNGHSLLYRWEGTDPALPPLLLLAHMDVVPAPDEQAWTFPPFSGAVVGGYVWGRGTLDVKVALAAILEAAEQLLEQDFRPRRTLLFAFGHDEEIGGREGATQIARLLQRRQVRPWAVVDEGLAITQGVVPGTSRSLAMVGLTEKGSVNVRLQALAQDGHTSMPPAQGAVYRLARAIGRIERAPFPARLTSPLRQMLRALAPLMPWWRRPLYAYPRLFAPLLLRLLQASPSGNAMVRTTCAPTMLQASPKSNVLPAKASALLNLRLLLGDAPQDALAHLRRVVDDPQVTLELLTDEGGEAAPLADTRGEAWEQLCACIGEVFPDVHIVPSLVLASTDSRKYASLTPDIYRFLPMRLGPEDLPRVHGVDERIGVDNYLEVVAFYRALMRRMG